MFIYFQDQKSLLTTRTFLEESSQYTRYFVLNSYSPVVLFCRHTGYCTRETLCFNRTGECLQGQSTSKKFNFDLTTTDYFSAEISVRSPESLLIFIIYKFIFRIKASKECLI